MPTAGGTSFPIAETPVTASAIFWARRSMTARSRADRLSATESFNIPNPRSTIAEIVIMIDETTRSSIAVYPALNFDWFLCRPDETGGKTFDSKTVCSPASEGTDCGGRNFSDGVYPLSAGKRFCETKNIIKVLYRD